MKKTQAIQKIKERIKEALIKTKDGKRKREKSEGGKEEEKRLFEKNYVFPSCKKGRKKKENFLKKKKKKSFWNKRDRIESEKKKTDIRLWRCGWGGEVKGKTVPIVIEGEINEN